MLLYLYSQYPHYHQHHLVQQLRCKHQHILGHLGLGVLLNEIDYLSLRRMALHFPNMRQAINSRHQKTQVYLDQASIHQYL